MAEPHEEEAIVLVFLTEHFQQSGDPLTAHVIVSGVQEQLTEDEALNGLRLLYDKQLIEGSTVEEAAYPVIVTGIGFRSARG